MRLNYWLEAFPLGRSRLGPSVNTIGRFEARLSTKPLTSKTSEDDWKWPGDQVGSVELSLAEGDGIPETVHLLAHYHDNYFDCTMLFTNLKEAKAKFEESEQELWKEVKEDTGVVNHGGTGVVKMSRYHCALVMLEDGIFTEPDKGSTWMLLPYVRIER